MSKQEKRKIYNEMINDDSIKIEIPECKEGVAYFNLNGRRYSALWSEEEGIDEGSIEEEVE